MREFFLVSVCAHEGTRVLIRSLNLGRQDGNFYLLDFSRVLPPETPDTRLVLSL
mgnify:FL=1